MNSLDTLREAALAARLKGMIGGNRVLWTAKHVAQIRQYISDLPERTILGAIETKFLESPPSTVRAADSASRASDPTALKWRFQISNGGRDLADDVIKPKGWNFSNFAKNGPVHFAHDTGALPVGQSSMPWLNGSTVMADVTFPESGVSPAADQVRAMVGAGILRGASVGFIPGKFKFASDPARPMGIDFEEGHTLTEWSICSVPCNSSCLAVGPASSAKSASYVRNVPIDDYPLPNEECDWECCALGTMPIDASDDSYDAASAKAALLANFSPNGTIEEDARKYFFAVKTAAPFDAASYQFPFCRVGGGGVVASKTGWRQSLAALEKSTMPGVVVSQARALVEALENRLGEVKTVTAREKRIIEARKLRLIVEGLR